LRYIITRNVAIIAYLYCVTIAQVNGVATPEEPEDKPEISVSKPSSANDNNAALSVSDDKVKDNISVVLVLETQGGPKTQATYRIVIKLY